MNYVGVDIGGTNIRAGVVNEGGDILAMDSISTLRDRCCEAIVKDLVDLVCRVVKSADMEFDDLEYIGVGLPGSINRKEGILIFANNFGFRDVPLARLIQEHINLPVYLQNDANCAALAESVAGAAKDVSSSITITLGTGIGGGIVLGGEIYSGFNDVAGELGHMVIVSGGETCSCGRKGCWEAYASATALIRQTKRAALKNPDSLLNLTFGGEGNDRDAGKVFEAEAEGCDVAARVVKNYIHYLAEGITDLINIFSPELLVVGGGISQQGENLLSRLRPVVEAGIYYKGRPHTEIVKARLGGEAGIVGAAMIGA